MRSVFVSRKWLSQSIKTLWAKDAVCARHCFTLSDGRRNESRPVNRKPSHQTRAEDAHGQKAGQDRKGGLTVIYLMFPVLFCGLLGPRDVRNHETMERKEEFGISKNVEITPDGKATNGQVRD